MITIYLPNQDLLAENFFLFLEDNICCGYSLEVPHLGTSNEYPQHMFSLRNKKYLSYNNACTNCQNQEVPELPSSSIWKSW